MTLRPSPRLLTLLTLLVAVAIAAPAHSQAPSVPQPTAAPTQPRLLPTENSISGVVLNARTGSPVPRAIVTVSGTGGGAVVATTESDAEGHFAFHNLRHAKYALRAEAHGFVAANYQEHEDFSTAVAVGAGLPTDNLRLELQPEAALRGRVTDEMGDGVREARVTVYRETHDTGRPEVVPAGNATTDDLGDFEAGPLRAGRYFVAVSGRPWWAVYPRADTGRTASGIDPALDAAYPLTFAPGVTDSARATAVTVIPGEVARADVALVPVRAVTLTMHRSRGGDGPTPGVMLRVPAFNGTEMAGGEMEFGRDSLAIHGLAPGEYQMQSIGGDERQAHVSVGEAGADVTEASGDPLATVDATLTAADGGSLPGDLILQLRSQQPTGEDDTDRGHAAGVRGNGESHLRGIPQGTYRVLVFNQGGPVTVEQLRVRGKVVPNGALAIGEGSTDLQVTVAPSLKSVNGIVDRAGQPVSGAMVVLVPVDSVGVASMYRRDQSDQDGTFSLLSAVPGRYIVVAIQNGWGLNWSQPGALNRYLARGVAVDIKPGMRGTLTLPRPVELQPR